MTKPSPETVANAAAAFAGALDADDFGAAARLLAPECVYETGRETLTGPDAIVASYAAASSWARRTFDDVRYESAVDPPAGAEATILFTDYLLKVPGQWHRHRCRQTVAVDATGMIVRVVHHDLPGERESLDAWFLECGIER